MVLTIDQRVRAGIAFLDARGPRHWRKKIAAAIKAKRFDLGDARHCPLGEVYGTYVHGLRVLGLTTDDDAEAYGFERDWWGTHHELTEAWIRLYRDGARANRSAKTKGQNDH